MNRAAWSQPVSPAEAAKRAGGRRRANAQRSAERAERQWRAVQLWKEGFSAKEIAQEMGLSPHLVNRYTRAARRLAMKREMDGLMSNFFRLISRS